MSHNSTRLSIPIPDLTDAADVPASMSAAIAVIDTNAAWISKGTFASRPAAGTVAGKLYYATDTGAFYVTDGTTWQLVNPYPASDPVAATAGLRTLGTGSQQAAAGNDSRLSDTRTPTVNSVATASLQNGAVVWTKMGFANPIPLAKVGMNGSGFTTPQANVKAGRQLAATDFTTLLGMTAPRLLLAANGVTTDSSGNGVTITNTGSVGVTGAQCSGIDGATATSFSFDGTGTQRLTAPNSMKQSYGTWGCWFKTTQRALPSPQDQVLISMWQAASSDQSFRLLIDGTTGLLRGEVSVGGGSTTGAKSTSLTMVADGNWHFVAMSWDGTRLCIFVDGVMESDETVTLSSGNLVSQGPANRSAALLLGIGANGNGGSPFEGRISNVYVTFDVLDETAHRSLYAKKYAHGLGTQPELYVLNVRKYFRSKTYTAADFTSMTSSIGGGAMSQPLMGGNMENTTWVNDFGSLGNSWSSGISDVQVPYPFQGQQGSSQHGAFFVNGTGQVATGSDTGLPSGSSPGLYYGVWFKCRVVSTVQVLFAYGTNASNAGRCLWIDANGVLQAGRSGQNTPIASGVPGLCDGNWHFVVVVENNSTFSVGIRKIYVDGILAACDGSTPGTITLGGASGANIGQDIGAGNKYSGFMGGFFIGGSTLPDSANILELYNKVNTGSILTDRQPMDPSSCIERADATNIYWIGDDLEPTDYVELYAA